LAFGVFLQLLKSHSVLFATVLADDNTPCDVTIICRVYSFRRPELRRINIRWAFAEHQVGKFVFQSGRIPVIDV
jgi:hypothetical protein